MSACYAKVTHCALLKLVTLSVLVLSFRLKSSVVQVLLKEKKNTSNFSRVKTLQSPVYTRTNMVMKKTNATCQ